MASMIAKRELARIHAGRQRRRWRRRTWDRLIGDNVRGLRTAYREFRAWLNEDLIQP